MFGSITVSLESKYTHTVWHTHTLTHTHTHTHSGTHTHTHTHTHSGKHTHTHTHTHTVEHTQTHTDTQTHTHTHTTVQYNFIVNCQYGTDCTRNVLWCQVHSSHIHSNQKTLNYNNSK